MTIRVHSLTREERDALHHLHRTTKEPSVRSRCDMMLWSDEGLSPPQIASRVRFCRETVVRQIKRYEKEGLAGLSNKRPPGRPARVTSAYLEQVEQFIDQPPRAFGLSFSNWTTKNLATYMAQQTGIVIQARQMENYLKAHDWRLRRPVRTIKQHQNPTQVEAKKRATDGLSAGSKQPGGVFAVWRFDESQFTANHHPLLDPHWTPAGHPHTGTTCR